MREFLTTKRVRCFSCNLGYYPLLPVLAIILVFSCLDVAFSQATLTWDPPGNVENIVGYRVYYGNSRRNYGASKEAYNQTSILLDFLSVDSTHYLAVVAYDSKGNESSYSNEVIYQNYVSGNPPPLAFDNLVTTTEGTPVDIDVVANDTDTNGTVVPATVAVTNFPTNGTATNNWDGTVTYTPDLGFIDTDNFTYTVQDDLGATSNEARVTISINSGTLPFFDDFNTDTSGSYTVTYIDRIEGYGSFLGNGSFLYDSDGKRAQVITGSNVALQFSRNLPISEIGSFCMDFTPTTSGVFELYLRQDANNYYLVKNTDGFGTGYIAKYVGGGIVDIIVFSNGFEPNSSHKITINFSPSLLTVTAFDEVHTISTESSSIMVHSFEVNSLWLDAYYDNISYTGNSSKNRTPDVMIANPASNRTIYVGESIAFSGTAIDPDNNTPFTYLWDFGNPEIAPSTVKDPGMIQFKREGVYVVTLTVTGSMGLADLTPATRTITVVSTNTFSDDFNADTTEDYTVTDADRIVGYGSFLGSGSFLYDSVGGRAQVVTGSNVGLQFSRRLPMSEIGSFSMDLTPTTNGIFELYLRQDENNYYLVKNTSGFGPGYIAKYVGGAIVDIVVFSNSLIPTTSHTITIDFSPSQLIVTAFGEVHTLNTTNSGIMVNGFEVNSMWLNAYYDNISYTAGE